MDELGLNSPVIYHERKEKPLTQDSEIRGARFSRASTHDLGKSVSLGFFLAKEELISADKNLFLYVYFLKCAGYILNLG